MDENGDIYSAAENEIPIADKARLEGYLRGRAEETEKKIKAIEDALKAKTRAPLSQGPRIA